LAGGTASLLLIKNSGRTSFSAAEPFLEVKTVVENPAASAAEAGVRPAVAATEPQETPDMVSPGAGQPVKPAGEAEADEKVPIENLSAPQSKPTAPPGPDVLIPPPSKTTSFIRHDIGPGNFSLDPTNKNPSLAIGALNIGGKAAAGITGLSEAGLGKDAMYRNRLALPIQSPLKSPLWMTVYLPREYRWEQEVILRIWPVIVTQTQGHDDPWHTEIPIQELTGTGFEEIPDSGWVRLRLSLPTHSVPLEPDVLIHRIVIHLSLSEVSKTAFVGLGEIGFGSAGPAGD
jgi:hypothetical protein